MKNRKIKILIILGTLATLAILVALLELTHVINIYHKRPQSSVPTQGPTAEQKQAEAKFNADSKKELITQPTKGDDPNSLPSVPPTTSIELTAQQEPNNSVTVFTKLSGYSDGSCELTSSNGSKTNNQSAKVIYQAEFSSCAGFSVPIDTIGKGIWSLKLAVTTNGTTATKTISYEVK